MILENYQTITKEDSVQCLKFVDLLLEISELSRMEGLLVLESAFINKVDFPILNLGLKFILDGSSPEQNCELLSNLVLSSKYSGLELLKGILTVKFIPLLQAGENKEVLQATLYSCLGYDIFSDKYVRNKKDLISVFLSEDQENTYPEGTNLLEEAFYNLGDNEIQNVIRNISNTDLVYALIGSSLTIKRKLIQNLSPTFANMVIEEIQKTTVSAMHINSILEAQNKILDMLGRS